MAVNNNLYPGIVDTYMPAFLIDSGEEEKDICKVYFSISQYNSISDIKGVQVTVSYQDTNKSALNKDLYPCDIMLTNFKIDETRTSDDKYYIEIFKTDMAGGNFEINQYYKVQFRFTGTNAKEISIQTPQAIDSWLAENLSTFSEWSTVCLVRGISLPIFTVSGLADEENVVWSSAESRIIGKLDFANPAETEVLRSYRIKLFYRDPRKLVSDSGILYTGSFVDANQFIYTFPYAFNEAQQYILTIEYETNDSYKGEKEYSFTVIQQEGSILNAEISAEPQDENGCVLVHLQAKNAIESFVGNITIRRTSSKSHFQLWEDVYTTTIINDSLVLDWHDFTVESGVWYKYCAQRRDSLGNRGVVIATKKPVMVDLEYFYLMAEGQQITIKFDHSISSFKRQVSEAKVETIGSKYPFINRTAAVDYKTFPISGTISFFMDEYNIFTSREDIFGEEIELYNIYNKINNISEYNDYIYERKFREKIMDFLYKNNVKLFRSATEGNILIKLMDINFTPQQVLGGYIYSFSCTAYEINECTLENINKYKIQPIGDYRLLSYTENKLGQMLEINVPADVDVIDLLNQKYAEFAREGFTTKIEYLNNLRIEMEDKPYLINEDEEQGLYIVDDKNKPFKESETRVSYLGYICYINERPVVINPEGIYELAGDSVEVTSLTFPIDTKVSIEYSLTISQTENTGKLFKSSNYFTRIGQYWGKFDYKDSIYQHIWDRYYSNYSNYKQQLVSLNKIKIEAEPGTVVYIKEAQDDTFERHVLGDSGTLEFNEDDTLIEGIYFCGIHLDEVTEEEAQRKNIPDHKYIDTGLSVNEFSTDERKLIKNGVYNLSDELAVMAVDYKEELRVDENNLVLTKPSKDSEYDGVNIYECFPIIPSSEFVIQRREPTGDVAITPLHSYNESSVMDVRVNQVELILEKEKTNGYQLVVRKPEIIDEEENVTVEASDDLVEEKQKMYTHPRNLFGEHFRLLTNRDYDKEFYLLIQTLLENTDKYIWFRNKWWAFTKDGDLICPVDGLIDYYCEVMRGYYA